MSVSFILVKWLNVHCTNRTAGLDLSPPTSSYPYILITRYCIGNLKRQKFQFSSCDSNGTIFITVYLWEQNELYPLYRKELYPLFPRKSGAKERNSSRVPRGLQLIFILYFYFFFLYLLFSFLFFILTLFLVFFIFILYISTFFIFSFTYFFTLFIFIFHFFLFPFLSLLLFFLFF